MFQLCSSYFSAETTQLKQMYSLKLDWGENATNIWSNVATLKYVGCVIGSFSGGLILNFGRRNALFIVGSFFLVASCLSLDINTVALYFTRLIGGIGVGLNSVVVNRFIEEFVPLAMYSTASPFNIFMGQLGTFIAQMSAIVLPPYTPPDEDQSALEATKMYYYIFGLLFVFLAIGLVGLLFFVRTDTPKFYLLKGDEDKAVKVIHTIYDTEGSQIQANKIMRFIQKSSNPNTVRTPMLDALWRDDRYRRATLVNLGVISFKVLTGYAGLMAFSTTIFGEAYEAAGEKGLNPRQGTYLTGLVNLIGAMLGIVVVRKFGRKTVLLAGHFTIGVLHLGVAWATAVGAVNTQISLVCLVIGVYMMTTGPCAIAYAAETCCDTALSLVFVVYYFWDIVISFTMEKLMEKAPTATFLVYAGITFLGVIFIWFFVGETKGLTEKEKKEIFMPGATWGRELCAGEQAPAELGNEHKSRRTLRSEMMSTRLGQDASSP